MYSAQLPVIIKFKSDEAVEHSSGFKLEYSVVPDDSSSSPVEFGEMRTEDQPDQEKSSAPTGLIIGILLIAIDWVSIKSEFHLRLTEPDVTFLF